MRTPAAALLALAILSGGVSAPPPATVDYFFVFLRLSPDAPHLTKKEGEKVQAGHLANIKRLYDEGHLVAAGPFTDETALRGILVLKTARRSEAQQWIDSDPAVQAGRLIGDLHPFTAPAGTFHAPKDADMDMETYSMVVLSDRYRRDAAPMHALDGYLDRLRSSGKLAFAAMFSDGYLDGVLILTAPPDEATKLALQNPLVTRGYMRAEVHPWISQRGVLVR